MFFALALLGTMVLMVLSREKWWDSEEGIRPESFVRHILRYGGSLFVAAFVLTFATGSMVVVPAGHRGVVFNSFSGVRLQALGEGLNFILPIL